MNREISSEAYDAAERRSHEIASDPDLLIDPMRFRQAVRHAAKDIGIATSTMESLVRNSSVIHTKRSAPVIKQRLPHFLEHYKNGSSIVGLAREAGFSQYLLARYMIEEISTFKGKMLSDAMRYPERNLGNLDNISSEFRTSEEKHLIRTENAERPTQTRLSKEVREAIDTDPLYGPMYDKERHIVGIEYEVVLEQELITLGIPFETEADLRNRGTSRTPDILLTCPLGVQVPKASGKGHEWKMICWIDSKAMFGDVTTHQTSVLPQAEAYVHRYGPGMVLYWFGHAPFDRLENSQGDIVIASWDLPDEFMWPTGEILKRDDLRRS